MVTVTEKVMMKQKLACLLICSSIIIAHQSQSSLSADPNKQAIYLLEGGGTWRELPSIDDGDYVTGWGLRAGAYRLGRRTIIVPENTRLSQNYPNPFNPSTTILWDVGFESGPEQQAVVAIYNLLGQHVSTLHKGHSPMGNYKLVWHGVDQRGVRVASGVYIVRLSTDSGYHATRKILLVR